MTTYKQAFASLSDALACAALPDANPAWVSEQGASRSSRTGNMRFTETPTWEAAAELAAQGDPESTARLGALRDRLTASVSSRIQRLDVVNDVYGESLDIGAYCVGVPDPWHHWEATDVEGPQMRFVRIIANISVSAGLPTSLIRNRGAALCALTECLELSGSTRVEVSIGWGTRGYSAIALAKPFEAPLEIDRLAFWLCHPSALRRIAFGCWEQMTDVNAARDSSYYGPPAELDCNRHAVGTIYMPGATYGDAQWATDESTTAWVMETLKAQGVDIHE